MRMETCEVSEAAAPPAGGPAVRKAGGPAGGDADRACYKSHKSPPAVFTWQVGGDSVFRLKRRGGEVPDVERPKRSEITEWSWASRRRCWIEVAAVLWQEISSLWFITLTYPGSEGREHIPGSGRAAKRHLQRFMQRWVRAWGPSRGIWKMEFQKGRPGEWEHDYQRRALHYHLWLEVTEDCLSLEELSERRAWIARTWWEIVGSGSEQHLTAGTSAELVLERDGRHPMRYFKGYLSRKGGKEYQNRVPCDFASPGRFWGWIGGLRPRWSLEKSMELQPFIATRRVLRRWTAKKRGHPLRCEGLDGLTVVAGPILLADMQAVITYYCRLHLKGECPGGRSG